MSQVIHTHIVDFSSVTLVVAPGEPDNPEVAKRFVLSWWEKNPPPQVTPTIRNYNGWCFVAKFLGTEARLLTFKAANDPVMLMAMFGVSDEYAYVNEEMGQ